MAKIQRNAPCPCGSGEKYKKCHGSVAIPAVATPSATTTRELRVRAFTDETGNSGTHLFDLDQPYFWTGTLVCRADIEREGAALHATCLRLTEQKELHGNALGLSRIEKIAHPLCEFFSKYDCLFFFTRIEKMHLAAAKLFDTLMDSGINKAVSNVHYGIRAFRLPLAVQLIQLMDDNDRHEFWEAYSTGGDASFREILTRLRNRLLLLHERGTYHDRTVEMLRDGLDWGIANPNDVLTAIRATNKIGPMAAYVVQGFSPKREKLGLPYSGRFFAAASDSCRYNAALEEWEGRKNLDLQGFWPTSELPFGFMTHLNNGGIPNHGYTHWWKMFNPLQLLIHCQLLKAITENQSATWVAKETLLGAFQQYLRYQNMFVFWQIHRDCMAPHFSNNNYHPKANVVENSVFSELGSGNWNSCYSNAIKGLQWARHP